MNGCHLKQHIINLSINVSFFQIECTANPTLCGWEYPGMEGLNLSNFTRMVHMSYFKVDTWLNFPPKIDYSQKYKKMSKYGLPF
jgi:hypothetical protein